MAYNRVDPGHLEEIVERVPKNRHPLSNAPRNDCRCSSGEPPLEYPLDVELLGHLRRKKMGSSDKAGMVVAESKCEPANPPSQCCVANSQAFLELNRLNVLHPYVPTLEESESKVHHKYKYRREHQKYIV
jgi:hypothetical protein